MYLRKARTTYKLKQREYVYRDIKMKNFFSPFPPVFFVGVHLWWFLLCLVARRGQGVSRPRIRNPNNVASTHWSSYEEWRTSTSLCRHCGVQSQLAHRRCIWAPLSLGCHCCLISIQLYRYHHAQLAYRCWARSIIPRLSLLFLRWYSWRVRCRCCLKL